MPSRVTCLATLALALPLPGQDHEAKARELLHAEDPAQRAWGAWHAGESGRESLASPLLRGWIEAERSPEPSAKLVRLAILDSLIRIGAELPSTELERIARTHPDGALILIAREPRRHAALLARMLEWEIGAGTWYTVADRRSTFAPHSFGTWFAIRNLAAKAAPRALALHLLSAAEFELVAKAGRSKPRGGGESTRFSSQNDVVDVPESFPPITVHYLSRDLSGEAKPFIDGPHTTHVNRTTLEPGTTRRVGVSAGMANFHRLEFDYLAHLLETEVADLDIHAGSRRWFAWKDANQWRTDVTGARRDIAEAYAALAARLVAADLLDAKTAQHLYPRIVVRVIDNRTDTSTPLPELPDFANEPVRIGEILWETDYDAAMQLARTQDKPLLVHFGENPG